MVDEKGAQSGTRADDTPGDMAELETMRAQSLTARLSYCRDALLANFTVFSAPIFGQMGLLGVAITP